METIPLTIRMDMPGKIYEVNTSAFPPFIVANPGEHTEKCLTEFAAYQMVMVEDGVLVASGLSVPVCVPGGQCMGVLRPDRLGFSVNNRPEVSFNEVER